jgi:pSer/pThr/pTyr-binding forkhead associated (FHA) protein
MYNLSAKGTLMDKKGMLYALLVGINQYQNPAVKNLEYAVADVEGLKNFMMERMGLLEDNHISLVNPSPGDLDRIPLRSLMLKYLNDYSTAPMEPDDTFIFYFAGHGYEKNETQYLLAVDSNPESEELLEDTAVSIPRLRKYLKKIQAGNQLLILDACRNDPHNLERGVNANKTDGSIMARNIAIIAKDMHKRSLRKFAIITASKEGQVSYEYPEGKHSWFCFNLLECLKEEPGPMVDILTLNEKIIDRMQQRAWKEFPGAQSQFPDIFIYGGRFLLPISTVPGVEQKEAGNKKEHSFIIEADVFKLKDSQIVIVNLLKRNEIEIGHLKRSEFSQKPNDINFRFIDISREHIVLTWKQKSRCYIKDRGSTHGTFLNGKKLDKDRDFLLGSGDRIQIGKIITYEFVTENGHYIMKSITREVKKGLIMMMDEEQITDIPGKESSIIFIEDGASLKINGGKIRIKVNKDRNLELTGKQIGIIDEEIIL